MVLTLFPPHKAEPRLVTTNFFLRPPRRTDWREWAELRAISRDFLVPWEPAWPADGLSKAAYRRRLQRYAEDWARDQGYAFFIFSRADEGLLGGITVANVRRGVSQSCTLGYWIGKPFARQGIMSEAIQAIIRFCFEDLTLHRIEAATLLHNVASQGVLRRAGFQREGVARRYLKINGVWQDHVLFSLLREDLDPVP